ncbi:Uu.00g107830.m01.CDS01 [Anthostomella pinea]|uniref:pectin lyase n=1 Tax=Anthostomella pinea TaxID=933095 RepID=A0AAI8YG14_9PEZI|nr:Uu.00g107830.m01.CDS01 [Anthostomella pinea]
MRSTSFLLLGVASAAPHQFGRRDVAVSGSAEGFASSVTGGGSATAVYPTTTDELVSYLGDDEARVIVLNQEFDFTGTEGTTTSSGCSPWGTGSACQIAINQNDWCTNYQPDAPVVSSITYDAAGVEGITVASDKTILGEGTNGVIKGKGLRMANGVSNIIIQNIHVTDINPQYVWGGDAITVDGADLIWIDHVKTSLIGRQHIVLGTESSGRVTISNNEIDGQTSWSATCDGNHYWAMYFTGSNDQITMKGNYVHHTSGRGPKVGGEGNTALHAVNNYFGPSTGHNFEIGTGAYVLAEGNVFDGVPSPVEDSITGQLFTADDTSACTSALGRACVANSLVDSGTFSGSSSGILADFNSNVAAAESTSEVSSTVPSSAGVGTI